MLTEENSNSNDLLKRSLALPSRLIYHSPNRRAEDAVLCQNSNFPKNPCSPSRRRAKNAILCQNSDSPKNPCSPAAAGVQRTQSFAGARGVPENPLYPYCRRQLTNQECRGRSPLPWYYPSVRVSVQLTNQECRGRSPLPGFGVSPKTPFTPIVAGS